MGGVIAGKIGHIAGKIGHTASTDKEGFTEDSQRKNFPSYVRGESAQLEKIGDPGLFK